MMRVSDRLHVPRSSRRWLLLCLFCAGISLPAEAAPLARYEYAQIHMGTKVRLVLYALDEAAALRAADAAFARIAALEQILSDHRPTSELMRLCAGAGGPAVPVSRELFTVLNRAVALARRSEGAFDPTVGPLVLLWRQARRSGRLPDPAALARARALVGWEKVVLNPEARNARLTEPGMRLDLGGIAKGYAGDCALAALKEQGVTQALFQAGGEIVVSGAPPGRPGWQVKLPGNPPRTLTVADAAVSTSGDTEQFVEIGGRRYSHVVDPRTGLGLTHRVAVSVVAPDGLTADGLSTAVSILGKVKGEALARGYPRVEVFVRQP